MHISKLPIDQKMTRRRIIELSYQSKLSHLGSNLSAVDLIDAVYRTKKKEERFILSAGHAGIALYVVLEKNGFLDVSKIDGLHIHPDRNAEFGIDLSTGSLGQGLPIATGMALADRTKGVFCLVTDGECAEGSIWESLRIIHDEKINNLNLFVNANNWGAYCYIPPLTLLKRIKGFGFKVIVVDGHKMDKILSVINKSNGKEPLIIFANTTVEQFAFLKGQDAHYYVMNDSDYKSAMGLLK